MSEQHTDEKIEQAVEKLSKIPNESRGAVRTELEQRLKYKMSIDDAVKSIFKTHHATHLLKQEYDSFSDWGGEIPPPNIDNWFDISTDDSVVEIQGKINHNEIPLDHSVYCLQFLFGNKSLQSLERDMIRSNGRVAKGTKDAWGSHTCLYVGYTTDLRNRIWSHTVGNSNSNPPPAEITEFADIIGFGVVENTDDKEYALDVEEAYAENLKQTITQESVFIYQA